MAKTETKRQHFVPRAYLKNFSNKRNDQYFINALPLNNLEVERIFETNINKIGLEKDIYTLSGETEEERQLIEKFYSENLEAYYNEVYKIVTDPNKTTINNDERALIISTVVTMFYRTTKWNNTYNQFITHLITDGYSTAQQIGSDYFILEKKKISIKDKSVEDIIKEVLGADKEVQILTQLQIALRLIELRSARDGIYVARLNDGAENEFLTSDHPVCFSNLRVDYPLPFNPENVLSLPVDNKHLLMLMPYADESTRNRIVRHTKSDSESITQKLTANFEQRRNADRFLFGTESSLVEYLARKEETERPLTDDEISKFKVLDDLLQKAKDLGFI